MAAGVGVYSALRLTARAGGLLRAPGKTSTGISVPQRTSVTSNTGALHPKPEKVSFGLIKVFTVVVPFLYVGTQISKNFAALLEEHDIFVPEDDDDDD